MAQLADYTTLGLGGPAKSFVSAASEAELIAAVRSADAASEDVLLLGGGSNLVIADDGFPGTVIHVANRGLQYTAVDESAPSVRGRLVDVSVGAGEEWDDVVAATVAEGLAGLECLSGIPGRAGATPVQNVGAYGQEVSEVITQVRVFDRISRQLFILPNEQCHFAYRTSLFKESQRYVVTEVTFRLYADPLSRPVRYAELASELGVEMGERGGVSEVRSGVLKIRGRKGMVLDSADPDTRSAGSFFTNPVLDQEQFARVTAAAGAVHVPRFDAGD